MKRGSPLKRRTPLRALSPKQREKNKELARAKRIVRKRAGGKCEARFVEDCAYWGSDVHHVVKRSQGGWADPDDLLYVCRPCHDAIEAHPVHARSAGFSKPHWKHMGPYEKDPTVGDVA